MAAWTPIGTLKGPKGDSGVDGSGGVLPIKVLPDDDYYAQVADFGKLLRIPYSATAARTIYFAYLDPPDGSFIELHNASDYDAMVSILMPVGWPYTGFRTFIFPSYGFATLRFDTPSIEARGDLLMAPVVVTDAACTLNKTHVLPPGATFTNSAPVTVTVPTAPGLANLMHPGMGAPMRQGGAGKVTLVAASGVTLNAPNGASTNGTGDRRIIEYQGADVWNVY